MMTQSQGNRIDKTPRNGLALTCPMLNSPNVCNEQNYQSILFSPSPAHSPGLHPSQSRSRFLASHYLILPGRPISRLAQRHGSKNTHHADTQSVSQTDAC